MHQILFHIPFTQGFMPPDGMPLYGFGAMLFLCFVLTAMWWGPKRVRQIGMAGERMQDLAIVLFVSGIVGARLVYIMQYSEQFKDKNLFVEFFKIWEGGIVFYGSAIGGVIGFLVFRHLVLKKLGINIWKLADALAPLLALGLAVGRVGCYLNGCCWGQVAIPEAQPMPLVAEMGQFPLLSGHARGQVTQPPKDGDALPQVHGVQTTAGFTYDGIDRVVAVEKGSAAEAVLKANDQIVKVNGTNVGMNAATGEKTLYDLTRAENWPRWKKTVDLTIDRNGVESEVSFAPKTVTFFPTQLYEVVSMGLLIALLLAFQPFRMHDGQVMVLMMVGYAAHRWLNEAIRIEPTYALGMTLSQWISIGIFAAAMGLEWYLWKTQPKFPKGPKPLSYGATPYVPPPKTATGNAVTG